MGLKVAVAVPFRQEGKRELVESEFVVALSLDRDWYSPDQAKRLLDCAAGEGLVERADESVRATFDPESVGVPEAFEPGESLLQERSVFERVLDDLVAAGADKREAVAAINDLQSRLGITIEAAAVLHACGQGVDASGPAASALADLRTTAGDGDEGVVGGAGAGAAEAPEGLSDEEAPEEVSDREAPEALEREA